MDPIDTSIQADFEDALLRIDRVGAASIVEKILPQNHDISQLENLMVSTLEKIGRDWESGSVSLSQIYMSSVICEELFDQFFADNDVQLKKTPRLAIAVLQDYHSLGKRMVRSVLRASGYAVEDLGEGLDPSELAHQAIKKNVDILLISTLMLPSALRVREVREQLTSLGSKMQIIVGGAPFRLDPDLWIQVGADADGHTAADIVQSVNNIWKGGTSI